MYGSDFGSGFLNSFSSSIVTLATADFQTLIGDQGLKEGGFAHAGLHGLVGCISAAATGADCAAGALGGVVQSVYAGTLEGKGPVREDYGSDEAYAAAYNDWKAKVSTNANLIGGAVGYVFSGGSAANVSATASIAKSGILNNYLTHNQWAVYRTSLEACGDDEDCRNVIHKWAEQTALTNHAAFLSCGEDRACLNEHFDQIEYEGDMSFATGLVQSLQAKDYYFASNSYLSNADGLQFLEFQSANCADVSDARCAGVFELSLEINRLGGEQVVLGALGVIGTGAVLLGTGCGGIIGCVVVGGGGLMAVDQVETGLDNLADTDGLAEQSNYVQGLVAAGLSPEEAALVEKWTGVALVVGDAALLGVGVLKAVGKGRLPDDFLNGFTDSGGNVHMSDIATAIGDDAATLNNFKNVLVTEDGHFVIVHGALDYDGLGGISFVNGEPVNTAQIAAAVRSNPAYVEGSQVCFASCWSGSSGTAQELANELGAPVFAPTRPVAWNNRANQFYIEPYLPNSNRVAARSYPEIFPEWKNFYPISE